MKEKLGRFWHRNKTWLLGALICLLGGLIGALLCKLSDSAAPLSSGLRSAAEKVGAVLIMAGAFGVFVLFIVLIVCVWKYVAGRISFLGASEAEKYYPCHMPETNRPWWSILILSFILPPLAVYYTIRKLTEETDLCSRNSRRVIVIGSVFMLCGAAEIVFVRLSGSGAEVALYVLPAFSAFFGAVYLAIGLFWYVRASTYDRYVLALRRDKITNIDEIARRMRTTYARAAQHIREMIERDLLPDAYIHHAEHEVIVPGVSEKIAMKCSGCAATTVLRKNEERICAYCGTNL